MKLYARSCLDVCECVWVNECGEAYLCAERCLSGHECVCVNECGYLKMCEGMYLNVFVRITVVV